MKKVIAAISAAAMVLTGCSSTDDRSMIEQMKDQEILVIGLEDDTVQSLADSVCDFRDTGASHKFVVSMIRAGLSDYWTREDTENALEIMYQTTCPEYL